jgi:hypothetical protein
MIPAVTETLSHSLEFGSCGNWILAFLIILALDIRAISCKIQSRRRLLPMVDFLGIIGGFMGALICIWTAQGFIRLAFDMLIVLYATSCFLNAIILIYKVCKVRMIREFRPMFKKAVRSYGRYPLAVGCRTVFTIIWCLFFLIMHGGYLPHVHILWLFITFVSLWNLYVLASLLTSSLRAVLGIGISPHTVWKRCLYLAHWLDHHPKTAALFLTTIGTILLLTVSIDMI